MVSSFWIGICLHLRFRNCHFKGALARMSCPKKRLELLPHQRLVNGFFSKRGLTKRQKCIYLRILIVFIDILSRHSVSKKFMIVYLHDHNKSNSISYWVWPHCRGLLTASWKRNWPNVISYVRAELVTGSKVQLHSCHMIIIFYNRGWSYSYSYLEKKRNTIMSM